MDWQKIIDKYYPAGSSLRDIFMRHSRCVADLALEIARESCPELDPALVECAAMLHDIGIFMTDAPGIECRGKEPYICHGVLGAALIRREAAGDAWCETVARVAERHTGTGLSPDDIERQHLPLPPGDYMPRTQLERLICFADKFYSKSGDMRRKSLAVARSQAERFGPDSAARFDALAREFTK